MEQYRRFSSFFSNFLSKISCKTTSGFHKYNDSNDNNLNKSVHKDIEEQNIEFNDTDEKLPSVVENNNIDNLAINDIKMRIDNGDDDDSDDEFIEFEQFKKNHHDDNNNEYYVGCNYDFQDKEIYNQYGDDEYNIIMITNNDKNINNIDDFDKNF
jgi:hypothetical protein